MRKVYFYRTNDPYGEFSNFAPYGFWLEEKYWKTSEHYFQAQKFEDECIREKIRLMKSPMEAALEGRNRENPIRHNWEYIKVDIMRKAIKAKFSQNEKLYELLLSTKGLEIIEHTKNDKFWADGGDGSGKNMLGMLLMELRDNFIRDNYL